MMLEKSQASLATVRRTKSRLLAVRELGTMARLDVGREIRKGIPEVILAEGKRSADVARLSQAMLARTGRAIISRADSKCERLLRSRFQSKERVSYSSRSGMVVVKSKDFRLRRTGGRVGILTAGTSDIPFAMEAETICKEMGCQTLSYYDVGVAGLHRLFQPLEGMLKWGADVLIVVAGREGALPTVVAGIADVPVIGLPTSRSYGFGEKGVAALAAMLQSCSLGMSVVNIDSGVGAGAVAAMIANRVGYARLEGVKSRGGS
jgi:pyridinium-3,5-biscarboxylic acid mononucleotide synthase